MLHQPAEAFQPSPAALIDSDAILVAALADLRSARESFNASPEGSALEASYEVAERAAFDVIVKTSAKTYAGLMAKAQVVITERNASIDYADEDAVAADIADGPQYLEDRITLALVLDIMRLAREERELRQVSEQAA